MIEEIKETIDRLSDQFPEAENNLLYGDLFIEEERGFQGHSVSDNAYLYYETVHNYSVEYKKN